MALQVHDGANGLAMTVWMPLSGHAVDMWRHSRYRPLVGVALDAARGEWAARRHNERLGTVGVALTMTASGLAGAWWTWPPLLACSAIWTRGWRWSWVATAQFAVVGVEWSYAGAQALRYFADDRLLVGVVWAGFAAALAGAGAYNVRRYRRDLARHR